MLASALVLGIAVGLVLGGRVSRLTRFRLAWLPLLALAVALRLLAPVAEGFAALAYVVAFVGIVAVAVRNAPLLGMPLIAGGALLNLVVVGLNGGMPVSEDAVRMAGAAMPTDPLHLTGSSDSTLGFLADVIPVAPIRSVYSAGDVLIAIGGALLAFRSVRE